MLSGTSAFSSNTIQRCSGNASLPLLHRTNQEKAEAAAAVGSQGGMRSQGWWPQSSCLQAQQLLGSQPLGRLCCLLQPSQGGMEMPAFETSPQTLLSPQKPPAKCTDRSPTTSVLPASWCIVRAPASARPKCHSSIVSSLTALHFILARSYKEYAVAGMGKIGLLADNRGI